MPIDNNNNIVFAFGPDGSFFFEAPGIRKYYNLPRGFASFLHHNPKATIKCLSFLSEGRHIVLYETHRGEVMTNMHIKGSPTKEIEAFNTFKKRRNLRTLQFNFYSLHSFYATALNDRVLPDYEVRWCGLPFDVDWKIQCRMIGNCWDELRPVQVVIGLEDEWAIVSAGGRAGSNCKKRYPKLDMDIHKGILEGKKVVHIAMNAFHEDQHYVLFSDGTSKWNVPAAYDHMVREVSRSILHSTTRRGSMSLTSAVAGDPHISAFPVISRSSSPVSAIAEEAFTRRQRPTSLGTQSSSCVQNTIVNALRRVSNLSEVNRRPENYQDGHIKPQRTHDRDVPEDYAQVCVPSNQKRKAEMTDTEPRKVRVKAEEEEVKERPEETNYVLSPQQPRSLHGKGLDNGRRTRHEDITQEKDA